MEIEGVDHGSSRASQEQTTSGPGLLVALAGDPSADLQVLLEQNCALQRRAALDLRRMRRQEKLRLVRKTVEKMKKASYWRIGEAALESAHTAAVGVIKVCCGDRSIATMIAEAADETLKKFSPLEHVAASLDREAKMLQAHSEAEGEAARDVESWLSSARDLERKMIDQLDAFQRAEHQERMQAIGR